MSRGLQGFSTHFAMQTGLSPWLLRDATAVCTVHGFKHICSKPLLIAGWQMVSHELAQGR